MITLITYDITEPKKLNNLRKFLKEFDCARKSPFLNVTLMMKRYSVFVLTAGIILILRKIPSAFTKFATGVLIRLLSQGPA